MIDRMDCNRSLVTKFLNEDELRRLLTEQIAKPIYEDLKKAGRVDAVYAHTAASASATGRPQLGHRDSSAAYGTPHPQRTRPTCARVRDSSG